MSGSGKKFFFSIQQKQQQKKLKSEPMSTLSCNFFHRFYQKNIVNEQDHFSLFIITIPLTRTEGYEEQQPNQNNKEHPPAHVDCLTD